MRVALLIVPALLASACGTPAFTSSMRTSFSPDTNLEATCLEQERDGSSLDANVKEMYRQGYRLIYVSEYTSSGRFGFPSTICFERPAQQRTAAAR